MEKAIDLPMLRERLEDRRLELKRRVIKQVGDDTQQVVSDSDRSALAQRYVSQERKLNNLARAKRALEQVEAALKRIDSGTYGKCTSCGKPIQAERLRVLPHTEFCINCQKELEKVTGA